MASHTRRPVSIPFPFMLTFINKIHHFLKSLLKPVPIATFKFNSTKTSPQIHFTTCKTIFTKTSSQTQFSPKAHPPKSANSKSSHKNTTNPLSNPPSPHLPTRNKLPNSKHKSTACANKSPTLLSASPETPLVISPIPCTAMKPIAPNGCQNSTNSTKNCTINLHSN